MSNKYSQESHGSYTEGIRVKISERYKPPPKINLVMSNTQRLNLSRKTIQSLPKYEFALEKAVKERIKELRNTRSIVIEQRKSRLEEARKKLERKENEKLEKENALKEIEEVEINCINDIQIPNNYETALKVSNYSSTNSSSLYSIPFSQVTYTNPYSSTSNMLIPTQVVPSYSNILTPIPSTNETQNYKPIDKSPFNISDFEADTSSPFDNMELKSINDMEELAQVLKTDDTYNPANAVFYSNYQPLQQSVTQTQNHPVYPNYQMIGNQYNYIPSDITYSQPEPVMSTFSNANGYYYSNAPLTTAQSFSASYPYTTSMNTSRNQNITPIENHFMDNNKQSLYRSVPDIMKALEAELENTHLDSASQSHSGRNCDMSNSSGYMTARHPVSTKVKLKKQELDDPYFSLPKNLQDLSRSISSMGFPLPMVARTCEQLGNDHKKIVEHLLAMTQLLDLGFPEKDVSGALLACNNDRDKALDKLIS